MRVLNGLRPWILAGTVVVAAVAFLLLRDGSTAASRSAATAVEQESTQPEQPTKVVGKASEALPTRQVPPPPMRLSSTTSTKEATGAALPTDVEQAIRQNPEFGEDLDCRDDQARFNTDYRLRLIAKMRECLEGRTSSTGRIAFTLHFDNDPNAREATGTDLTPQGSDLSTEDDGIVIDCLQSAHQGSSLATSDKYGGGSAYHMVSNLDLPLENSHVFFEVREGSYTAGTNFGCEVP